jgi:hypothetical protein
MTQYVQLRDSKPFEENTEFYVADARRIQMVEQAANALFAAWFPAHPEKGPVGEDFDNWHDIAISDAEVVVAILIKRGWIDDPTMDC